MMWRLGVFHLHVQRSTRGEEGISSNVGDVLARAFRRVADSVLAKRQREEGGMLMHLLVHEQ